MSAKKKRETGKQQKNRQRTQRLQTRARRRRELMEIGRFLDQEGARLEREQSEQSPQEDSSE